jgi:hypothetical protein
MQSSLWLRALHVAPWAQGLFVQRGTQSLLENSQRSRSWQSELDLQPTSVQDTKGLPCIPIGQIQIARWDSTLQVARLPHKIFLHGSTHSFAKHALFWGQSGSVWHSSIILRDFKVLNEFATFSIISLLEKIKKIYTFRKMNLHWKHSSWGLPPHPFGHRQTGLWDNVWHNALSPHGSEISQGSRHWCSIHALSSLHSESWSHSPLFTIV